MSCEVYGRKSHCAGGEGVGAQEGDRPARKRMTTWYQKNHETGQQLKLESVVMRIFVLLAAMVASTAVAVPRGGPQYQTDSGTVTFLRRNLVSGGEIQYPLDAQKQKQIGSLFVLMRLQPDGTVESLTTKHVTGDRVFQAHVERALRGYRFKPGTKGPLLWLVSFDHPATVIVKVSRSKDGKVPSVLFGRSR